MYPELPKISVIMSAYNCEKTILESINSILNQSFQDFEFLIADDCSTDRTKELIDSVKDERIKIFHNDVNCHYLLTWNRLTNLSQAPLITFQDADDISYPNRLKILYEKMIENDEVAIVGANFYRPFPNWKQGYNSNFKEHYEEIVNGISQKIINFYGTRALFNKKIFLSVGGFRDFFNRLGWEDFDLFLRIAENHKVCNVKNVLYEYRYYPLSSSKIKITNLSSKKIFIEDIGFFLHEQRMKNFGLDGIMEGGNQLELTEFLQKLDLKYKKDESIAFRKIAKNQISNKDFINALKNILIALKMSPLNISNWKLVPFLIFAYIRTIVKYIYFYYLSY